jgi:AraC-like DNA-binding protein
MALNSRLLASGAGWRVYDVICSFGPHDRPFEEQYDAVCFAAVTHGTFQYRSTLGSALLEPGAVLLGNHGHCFECRHDHGTGDRCLSFHVTAGFLDGIAGAVPGVRQIAFTAPRLPPNAALLPIIAAAEAARDDGDATALEEITVRLAGAVCATSAQSAGVRMTSRRDEQRISAALRLIETRADEPLPLSEMASAAAMSPYHFLRTFRAIVGMTPHQYILHTRLRRAAVRLRQSSESIAAVAYAAGFNDLSTFNRRFARIVGQSPSAYRTNSRR